MIDRYVLTPLVLDQRSPGLERVARNGWRLHAPTPAGASLTARLSAVHRSLAAVTADTVAKGGRPVSIAGDCCAAIGVLAGLQQAGLAPCLLWLDAHGDFNTWETTRTGFIGGMPLAMITGRGDQQLLAGAGCRVIEDDLIVLADARDLDPEEGKLLAGSGVHHARDLDRVVDQLPADRSVYVHFDLDLLDPSIAPALDYPTPGGPGLSEVLALGRRVREHRQVAAVSVTAWDPGKDGDGRTAAACLQAVASFLADATPGG